MRLLALLILSLALLPTSVRSQDSPRFDVDAVAVRTAEGSRDARVDVYVRIHYNRLTFLSSPDGFKASYEVTAEAYRLDSRDRKRGLARSRTWTQTAKTNLFARTRSASASDRTSGSLDLPPGRYVLDITLRDASSEAVYNHSRSINVRELDGAVAVSDLVLLDSYDASDNSITPAVTDVVGTDVPSLKLFYELYADRAHEVNISQQVLRYSAGEQSLLRSVFGIGKDNGREAGDVTYQRANATELTAGRNPSIVEIPISDLKAGDYLVRLEVHDRHGKLIDTAEKTIAVRWSGLDEHIRDLDEAVDQLQYIAKRRELDHIKSGKTRDEQMVRFQEFWEKRDPTPATDRNERMEEYYYRIDYANRRYSHLSDGWKTDRGYVMVLFGEPDFVEKPINFDVRPYEVWYYYRIGRRVVFIDRSGMGNYELMVPIWDERSRIR